MPFTDNFMPIWGPYSKKYMGISKIIGSLADVGARFDVTVHPTIWNSSVPVPNVTFPTGCHPWECAADYSYYSYRYELLGKDSAYADISFSKIDEDSHLIRCKFFNNTELYQNFILNIFASLEFPDCDYIELNAPKGSVIRDANDYVKYDYANGRPWDSENPDGMFKGMFRDSKFYLGHGLGDRCDNDHVKFYGFKPFGCEKGDTVSYKLDSEGIQKPITAIRYRTVTDGDAVFEVNGKKLTLPHSDSLRIEYFDYIRDPVFISDGGAGVEFDFIAVINAESEISVTVKKYKYIPETVTERVGEGFRTKLHYEYDGCNFSILTNDKNTRVRKLESGCLEDALVNRLSNGDATYDRLNETFSHSFSNKTSDEGFFHNTLIKSIFVAPNSSKTEYAVISSGDFMPLSDVEYEKIYKAAREKTDTEHFNKDGTRFALSTDILRSTLLTNTVYPVFLRGKNVIHHTPGKRWDSFYTWDSGFIGLGLLEFSNDLCRYVLETYLSDESNTDFDFLLHGSLVPTQFAEYYELLKRTENKHSLDGLYPKMKRYYEFLRGRRGSSSCDKFKNGLLTVYDYWYSCSGMDDYPPQVAMIRNKAQAYSCPCLTTCHIIRAGKILKAVALYLGKQEDAAEYENDIDISSRALNSLAWDEESGYYGYTLYDSDKNSPRIMKTESGENYNKGFDGVYPLFAGAAVGERKERLINHLKNPNELWSNAGLSAVDMSAGYYFDDGYWNGNVWMSHQWFFWKTMLDIGDTDFAFAIADRALEVWREETDFSYNTYECFGIKTRRGGWFHNFGGLSSPICIWADAYYKPGTVTSGFDVWTDYQHITPDRAEISFKYYGESEKYSIIITLNEKNQYKALLDGRQIDFKKRTDGALEFTFDGKIKTGVLKVEAL